MLLGFLSLADGLILWPVATLLVGVLCGATAFADEQQGPFRFLGDQRLPLGRFWLVKVGVRFAASRSRRLWSCCCRASFVALAASDDDGWPASGRPRSAATCSTAVSGASARRSCS